MAKASSLHQNSGAGTTENAAEESENFVLNVDLSDCVGLPAHFRIWVQKDSHRIARSMRWLGERVRRSANLRGPFLMQVDKYFLPPDESLKLLRSTDSIRMTRMKNDWQRPFCYNLGDDQVDSDYLLIRSDDEIIEDPDEVQDARPSSPANVSPVPQPSPQNSPVPSANNAIKQNSPSVTTDQISFEPPAFPSADPNLQRVKRRALALLQEVTGNEHQESQDDVDAPRKRRKRVRRRRPARPISPFPDPQTQMSVSMDSPAESVNSSSLPKKTYLASPLERPGMNYSQTSTQNSNPTSLVTDASLQGYLRVIPRYDQSYQATIPEVDCQSLNRPRSPSPASQTVATPKLVSAAAVALVSLEPAPAPVLRNVSVTRAPRVVRAVSNAE